MIKFTFIFQYLIIEIVVSTKAGGHFLLRFILIVCEIVAPSYAHVLAYVATTNTNLYNTTVVLLGERVQRTSRNRARSYQTISWPFLFLGKELCISLSLVT